MFTCCKMQRVCVCVCVSDFNVASWKTGTVISLRPRWRSRDLVLHPHSFPPNMYAPPPPPANEGSLECFPTSFFMWRINFPPGLFPFEKMYGRVCSVPLSDYHSQYNGYTSFVPTSSSYQMYDASVWRDVFCQKWRPPVERVIVIPQANELRIVTVSCKQFL